MDLLASAYDDSAGSSEEDVDSKGNSADFTAPWLPHQTSEKSLGEPAASYTTPGVRFPPKSTIQVQPQSPGPSSLGTSTRTTLGYVSKRKRKAQSQSEGDSGSAGTLNSENCLSLYLAAISSSESSLSARDSTKRAKHEVMIPKLKEAVFVAHTKPVLSLEWHPTLPSILLSASLDGTIRLWDTGVQQRGCVSVQTPHGSEGVRDVEWVTNETTLSGGYDRSAVYTDIGCRKEIVSLKHSSYVSLVKPHPSDKNLVLTGDFDGILQMWDLRSSKSVKNYKGAGGKILDAIFLPGVETFVASSDIVRKNSFSQAINVWDIASGVTLAHQLYFEPFTCPSLRLHPSREEFMAQSNGNYIVLFSARKPFKMNKRKRFQGHFVSGFDVGFDVSSDGNLVCSGSSEGKVCFYDYFSSKLLRSQALSSCSCVSVTWSKQFPCKLAVSDWDGKVYVLQ